MFVLIATSVTAITTTQKIDENNEADDSTEYNNYEDQTEIKESVELENKYTLTAFPPKSDYALSLVDPDPELTVAAEDLPDSFSWKSFGGDWTTPAKDQQSCGSCWAFGALGGMEAAINIAKDDPDFDVDLSEQYILACLSAAGSCSGGWMSEAIAYIKSTDAGSTGNGINGCPLESCFPYQAVDYIPCDDKCPDWDYYTTPPAEDNILFQVEDYGVTSINPTNPNDWDLLKSWVYTYGPIVVDIYASSGWSSFWGSHHSPTDIYEGTETYVTNHAQVLCGWVDDSSVHNGGYWILKNSWGTSWGYGGFNNVAYGCLQVGDRDVTWVTTTAWPQAEPPDPHVPLKRVYAGWSYAPDYPKVGNEIQFNDQSNGPVVMWEWDFNDDGVIDSTDKNPEWTYNQQGEYKVNLKVWASSGFNSELTKTVIVKDIWPPVAVSRPAYYGGEDNVVYFEGRYSYDPDGTIKSYAWDFNGDGTIDSTEAYETYSYPDQNGEYTATLTVTDNEGAEGTVEIPVKIDKTVPPVTTAIIGGIDQNEDQWFNEDVDVELVATDWSGVTRLYYRVDSEDWNTIYCDGEIEYSHIFKVRHPGIHTVEYYAKDIYGHIEDIKTASVKIDETSPTLDYTFDGEQENGVYITPVEVTINANDDASGIEIVQYKETYGSWEDYNGPFTINQGGVHTIYVIAVDNAGNFVEGNFKITLAYGPDKPSISGPYRGDAGTEYTFSFRSTDSDGGQVAYFVEWDDGTDSGWTDFVDSGVTVSLKHTWTEQSVFTLRAKAKDDTGAESEWSEHSISLPKARAKLGFAFLRQLIEQFPILERLLSLPFFQAYL